MIYLELFYTFFKIGILTFGGGYAMIPMIESEIVSKGWLTMEMLSDFIAVSELTPGSFAVNISTFVGNSQAGILGSMCATLGVVSPSFVIILIVYQFYKKFIKNRYVSGVLVGLRAVVVGLIFGVAVTFLGNNLLIKGDSVSLNFSAIIILFILVLIKFIYKKITNKKLNPIIMIIISACLGLITYGLILQ